MAPIQRPNPAIDALQLAELFRTLIQSRKSRDGMFISSMHLP